MAELIVMRLADMTRVHPGQIEATCSKCGHTVGVYPSGQKIMKDHPGIALVCQACREPADVALLAPGAIEEATQSKRKQ